MIRIGQATALMRVDSQEEEDSVHGDRAVWLTRLVVRGKKPVILTTNMC